MKKTRLPLTDNFIFKAVFAQHEDLLLDLLNSFPEFSGEKKIVSLKVLNPELPKISDVDKLSILDIRAKDSIGNQFLIEMQSDSQLTFGARILYYWSKIFSKSLKKAEGYLKLPKVYSINFTEFRLTERKHYYSVFQLLEKSEPEIRLTDLLEIHILELPKFKDKIGSLKTDLETWIFALKEMHILSGDDMNILVKKNPKIKKAATEYKEFTSSEKNRILIEQRKKADLDYLSGIEIAEQRGIEKGIEKGIEQTVLKMLEKKASLDFISEVTGLAIPEIIAIQKKHSRK